MNANELRIGNWVQTLHSKMPYRVCELVNKIIHRKETETLNRWLTINSGVKNKQLTFGEIAPIPLTLEILDKCGFEISCDNEFYTHFMNDKKFGVSLCNKTDDICEKGKWYVGEFIEIPSLHWLQNYYFFNHKIELEIKL